MTDRRITKVRCKGGKVEIHEVETDEASERTTEIVHKCAEAPARSFEEALGALVEHVRAIMEWPKGYAEDQVEATGVSFSMSKSDVEGAVISGHVKLAKTDGAWAWSTPHLPFEPYDPAGKGAALSDEAVEAVKLVRAEARKYLGGERAQMGLFQQHGQAHGFSQDVIDEAAEESRKVRSV